MNKPFKSTSSGPGAGEGSAGDTWLNITVLLPSGDKGLEEIMGQNTPGTGEGNEEQVKGGCGGGREPARGAVNPGLGARESAQSDCPAEKRRTTFMGLLDKVDLRAGGPQGERGHLHNRCPLPETTSSPLQPCPAPHGPALGSLSTDAAGRGSSSHGTVSP